ncbi:MAG: DNA helicase RecG [Deltaproteobacteria bacterium HGW-Deltaproteobacteria-19]|nr:MAG: DNA helicase RecG [Deltaproteobacteria bacterium HGW-Deltaproteobacteria-19]
MESVEEILQRMEGPLRFASREGYRHVSHLRDVEPLMAGHVAALKGKDWEAISPGPPPPMGLLEDFGDAFRGYDDLPEEQKKNRIARAIRLFDEIRRWIPRRTAAAPDASPALPGTEDIRGSLYQLATPARYVRGVGPRISALLEKKGLVTVEDLLYFLPRRYEDRREIRKISAAIFGRRETVVGKVAAAGFRQFGRRRVFEAAVDDGTGTLLCKWFQGGSAYLKRVFQEGSTVILTGEIRGFLGGKEMIHPDYEVLDDEEGAESLHFRRIVPVYSETEGLYQKVLRRILAEVLEEYAAHLISPIPPFILQSRRLPGMAEAVREAHFPGIEADLEALNRYSSPAHRRLIYDEFFFLQLGMALRRSGQTLEEGIVFQTGGPLVKRFLTSLPFRLTVAQKRVLGEIAGDMGRPHRMNRLLQGDVGSGKTVVAFAAIVAACENGCQGAFMAPTEILALQHFQNIRRWAEDLGLRVGFLSGGRKGNERKETLEAVSRGEVQVVVGTHALIQECVEYRRLGLVVIDEQHRFGVLQRAILREKGGNPDVLVMTATPIPRTLAMTVYGDLDVSILDEMPPGKKPVDTRVVHEQHRGRVYDTIRREVRKGNQAFIVYPLVEESEALDLKDATRMAEHLQKEIFPEYVVGLVTGQMKGPEKEAVMADFAGGKIHILVSTTVIEVGIDIPEASVMVIEHAERFGLSQLHQLRGRVGRGAASSICILLAGHAGSADARRRLRVMEETQDGFRIAEEDLAIRGPGEFLGTRQSGLPDFRVADIVRDGRILAEARADAFALAERDPRLERPEHTLLKEVLLKRWHGRLELARVG